MLDAPGTRVRPPLKMRVEVADGADAGATEELARRMHDRFGVTPQIQPVPAGALPRESHKQKVTEVAT